MGVGQLTPRVILVPMTVDAYLNYAPRLTDKSNPQDRAYVAPITVPNLDGLQLDNGLVQHDIFDAHRDAPYMSNADRYRVQESRQGIYIHWSLPKVYRTGISGSTSAQQNVKDQKSAAGYPDSQGGADVTTFRPVPTRWVICRTIRRSGDGNSDPIQIADLAYVAANRNYTDASGNSNVATVRDLFVVESVN